LQKCKKAQSEGENTDTKNKIKIVYKEFIEPFFYYWICIDPTFCPKDVWTIVRFVPCDCYDDWLVAATADR
ncbi:MAG: hypothetical protein KKD69_00170, partial [Euryarchaeota archaeon]|nr:hypothetical protein [Euryarchaeota archaeon]